MATRTNTLDERSLEIHNSRGSVLPMLDNQASTDNLGSSFANSWHTLVVNRFNGGSPETGYISITMCTVGTGMMLLSGVSTYSGLILSLIQLIVCCMASYYSILTLIRCAVYRRVCSYQELAEMSYGKTFRWFTNLSIFIGNAGIVVLYFRIISSLLSIFLTTVSSNEDLKQWIMGPGDKFIPILIATFFVLPLCLPKYLKQLRFLWAASLVCIVFMCGVIIYQAMVYQEIRKNSEDMTQFNLNGISKTFPTLVFAFLNHYNVLDVFGDLSAPSKRTMKKVVQKSTAFVLVLYSLTIFFGYITFSNPMFQNYQQIILMDYIGTNGTPSTLITVCLLIMPMVLISKMPVFVIPAKDGIKDIFFPRKADRYGQPVDTVVSPYVHFVLVAITIYCCAGISTFVKNIVDILSLISSSFFIIHCFVFPALFYINLSKLQQKPKHTVISKIIIVTMTLFAGWNTYNNIVDLV